MQCAKFLRCTEMAEPHRKYCVSHVRAHAPKIYCEHVLADQHRCSNYARKGMKTCASHGPPTKHAYLRAWLVDKHGLRGLGGRFPPELRAILRSVWLEHKVSHEVPPCSETYGWENPWVANLKIGIAPDAPTFDIEPGTYRVKIGEEEFAVHFGVLQW